MLPSAFAGEDAEMHWEAERWQIPKSGKLLWKYVRVSLCVCVCVYVKVRTDW